MENRGELALPSRSVLAGKHGYMKSSVGILQERKNAFGLHGIYTNGDKGYSSR